MVWEAVNDHFVHFKQWPNPTKNMVADIRVLACEDTWQAKIKMYGEAAANWAWSVFVPQPTEIERKTVTGSYKCGFYLGLKVKSPIDIIPGATTDAPNIFGKPFLSSSEMFAEIARPAVTGLFYLWAAASAYEALSSWQTMVYAGEMCDLQHNECLLADGIGSFFNDGGLGEPNQYVVLHDPNGWHPSFSGFINIPEACWLQADAIGTLDTGGAHITSCDIFLGDGSSPFPGQESVVHFGPLPAGTRVTWSLSWGGFIDPTVCAVTANIVQTAGPFQRSTLTCKRFTVTESPTPRPNNCVVWHPADP